MSLFTLYVLTAPVEVQTQPSPERLFFLATMADSTATTHSNLLLPSPAPKISRRFLEMASKPARPWVQFVRTEENAIYYDAIEENARNHTATDVNSNEDGGEAGTNAQAGLSREDRGFFDLGKEMRFRREAYEASRSGLLTWFRR